MTTDRIESLEPLIASGCRILILGSMPGVKSIEKKEYYANPGNQFRKLVFAVFGKPFDTSYEAFVRLLAEQKIGLWNVIRYCRRKGSADHNISEAIPNDLGALLAQYPKIDYIFFESLSAQKFHDRLCTRHPGITYGILPSTSGLNARMSFDQKLEKWEILRTILS